LPPNGVEHTGTWCYHRCVAQRLEIGLKPALSDPLGEAIARKARDYLGLGVEQVRVVRVLTFDTALSPSQLERARAEIFTNPVTEISSFSPLAGVVLPGFDWVIWVGFKPGVRDNEGATAMEAISDALGHSFSSSEAIFSSRIYVLKAPALDEQGALRICEELLANALIQSWRVIPAWDWNEAEGVGIVLPRVKLAHTPTVQSIPVASDEQLLKLSAERELFLDPRDVPVIRAYFNDPAVRAARAKVGLGDPTDVELEFIAQARSDHCNHNTFRGRFYYRDLMSGEQRVVANLFEECIKRPTQALAESRPWVVSVLWDNGGVAALDDEYCYAITAETHNSPSNMEPYGGALTGIVGVYRDPMGTGLGSKLVAGMWGYCVGPRDYPGPLAPPLHPRRLLDGVVEGVRDGGNKSGIPTVTGNLFFHPGYLGKCLVFVGAVGVMPREVAGRPAHLKAPRPGDLIVMCGGRVGIDGIHGVTASSAEFSEATPAGHVQIGDPYTQKKLHEFLLEARDEGLIQFITDNGGGGLSSSVGESARMCGGAEVALEKVPLKYEGLDPWQIWVSESQERMTVGIAPEHEERFMQLAAKHAVEATVIGRYNDSGKITLTYEGKVCAQLDVELFERAFPQWEFDAHWLGPDARGLTEPVLSGEDPGKLLLNLLDHPNFCCRDWISRQYDHEVQGTSVLKPLVGRWGDVPSEAAVIQPVLERRAGLAIAQVLLVPYGEIDTYHMVTASVEEGYRRVVAVGGDPEQVGGIDNFCWPSVRYDPLTNPDGRYKAAQLVRACWGLKDACVALGIPLLSGKDSMYIDGVIPDRRGVRRRISGPPTMMFTATAPVADLGLVRSLEPKTPGEDVYVLGVTRDELGGSGLYEMLGVVGRNVPVTDLEASKATCRALARALGQGLVSGVCVVSRGGLGYALARMVMASGLGMEVDLGMVPAEGELGVLKRLFSESTGRFVITAPSSQAGELERLFEGITWARVGRVEEGGLLKLTMDGEGVAELGCQQMRAAWRRRFGGLI